MTAHPKSPARFIFLTKTPWKEPPRIRHQLAHLLSDAGHEVVFFEKPVGLLAPVPPSRPGRERVTVVGYRELLHHKLRVGPPLHWANAGIAERSIRSALHSIGGLRADDVILNFNYEYSFLRRAFPGHVIITMINDDFISNAPFGMSSHLRWAFGRTCRLSDHVLTVSTPLVDQIAPYAVAELFLPWTDRPYTPPKPGPRDTLLFWGFINKRIDFPLLDSLAARLAIHRPDVRLLVVGPVEQGAERQLAQLGLHRNVEIRGASALDELPLDRTFASIIPYRAGRRDLDAAMLPNKAVQLLARGIPLVISALPHFIEAPFVMRIDGPRGDRVIDDARRDFEALQPAIRDFVALHGPTARLARLRALACSAPAVGTFAHP